MISNGAFSNGTCQKRCHLSTFVSGINRIPDQSSASPICACILLYFDIGNVAGVANNHESVAESSPGDGRIYDDISTSILAGVYDEDPGAMYDTIEDESSTTHGLR